MKYVVNDCGRYPLCVRADYGGEYSLVAREMYEKVGPNGFKSAN